MNQHEQIKELQERVKLLEQMIDSLRKKLSQAHDALAEEYIQKCYVE
jgi:Mg2+ and Co2+ transporter CorA